MGLSIDNIEDIAIGRSLPEVVALLNEAVGDRDPAHVEYWPEDEEVVLHYPNKARNSTIVFILARMVVVGMLEEVDAHQQADAECIRLKDAR